MTLIKQLLLHNSLKVMSFWRIFHIWTYRSRYTTVTRVYLFLMFVCFHVQVVYGVTSQLMARTGFFLWTFITRVPWLRTTWPYWQRWLQWHLDHKPCLMFYVENLLVINTAFTPKVKTSSCLSTFDPRTPHFNIVSTISLMTHAIEFSCTYTHKVEFRW